MSMVNELATRFSFTGSTRPLENFNEQLTKSVKVTAAFIAASAASITLINKSTSEMSNLAESVGLTTAQYQAYGEISQQVGMSSEIVADMLEEMNNKFGESSALMARGEKPLSAVSDSLNILGLQYKDIADLDPAAQFEAVSKAIENMPDAQKAASAADILFGGDANKFFSNMKNTGQSLDSLISRYEEINMLTEDGIKGSKEYTTAFRYLQVSLTSSSREIAGVIGGQLAPMIESMTKSFSLWSKENQSWIKDTAKKTGNAIVGITEFLGRMKYVIGALVVAGVAGFVALKVATIGWAASLAAVFNPVTLVVAGIAAALLIIDDLYVAFKGGKSIIRDFIKEWTGFDITPALQNAVKSLQDLVSYVGNIAEELWEIIGGMFSGLGDIWRGDFEKGFSKMFESAKKYVEFIKNAFTTAFNFIGDKLDSLVSLLPDFITGNDSDSPVVGGSGQGLYGTGNAGLQGYQYGGNLSRRERRSQQTSVTQSNDIKIYSNDPVAAGQAVANASSRQLREATDYYDRGGQ